MNEDARNNEDEKHIEITIGEPIAEKVIDSCVGTDNRRYYKVCWQATWEPEEELLLKYQHLVGEYWKETIAAQGNDNEQKDLISNLLENIMHEHDQRQQQHKQQTSQQQPQQHLHQQLQQHLQQQQQQQQQQSPEVVVIGAGRENDNNVTDGNKDEQNGDVVYYYKEVNSPEHKISDQPMQVAMEGCKKPPPLFPKKEEGPLPYKCQECNREYATIRKLKDHIRKLHINQGIYQCSECPKQFSTKRALQMHMNRHTGIGPHECPGCKKRYMTQQELEFHKKSCNALVDKDYQCEHCAKRFGTKTHLVFHMKIHLPDEEKPFKCQYCPRTFAYNHDCVHHMRLHVGEKPFQCTQCDMAFHRKSYLTEHMFVHTGVSKYRCDECQVYFKTQQMLQTHVKNVHIFKKNPKPPRESKKSKRTRNKHKCEDCGKEFRYVKEFHYHQMVYHSEKIEQNSKELLSNFEPTMFYKCKKCDKSFQWMSLLKRHSESHQKSAAKTKTPNTKGKEETDKAVEEIENVDQEEERIDKNEEHQNEAETQLTVSSVQSSHEEVPCAEGNNEINILACGHCMAGFTDEEDLNNHVITEHAELIMQAEVGTDESQPSVNQAQNDGTVALIETIQLQQAENQIT